MYQFEPMSIDNMVNSTKLLQLAHTQKQMNVLWGYSGAGKSRAVRHYASNNQGAFYVKLGESVSPSEMYIRILNSITGRKQNNRSRIGEIQRAIHIELRKKTGNKVLIIDETGVLKKKMLAAFREIRELTAPNCGLLLNIPDYSRPLLETWVDEYVPGASEFETRIDYSIELKRPREPEVRAVLEHHGVFKYKQGETFLKRLMSIDNSRRNWRDIERETGKFLTKYKRKTKSDENDNK